MPEGTFTINLEDVQAAAKRIEGIAHRTPVHTSQRLNALAGREIFLKAENLQRGGAFKFRGAYNTLSQLSPEQKERGVVAFSSGNHAQGVAYAAQLLGIPAIICMPDDAPKVKLEATRGYGADVRVFNRATQDRETVARAIASEHGMTIVPPFDLPQIMAGQGTVALELLEQVPDLDALVMPVGGGGLLSGCAIVARSLNPNIHIFGVETEGADDVYQSFVKGERVKIPPPSTIADGIRTQMPGQYTFPIIQSLVEQILVVSDEAVLEALRFLLLHLKLVIEPTGAVGVAAAISTLLPAQYRRVGVVISGGNIDPSLLASLW